MHTAAMPMRDTDPRTPEPLDFIEAGAGPPVVLVHASTAGARQWSALIHDLHDRFRVRAVNMFGYGKTPTWREVEAPTLDDFADVVAAAVPTGARAVHLVGHSFGGAVAMQAAARRLRGRVASLVLIEPSLFYLLNQGGRREAFEEISGVAACAKQFIADGRPAAAAESFIDYWCGPGAFAAASQERQSAFARAIPLVMNEFAAVLTGERTLAGWATALPQRTLVIASARTKRPAREIVEILSSAPAPWEFARLPDGSHMAPLTHPQLVNPLVGAFVAG
jgi:pimeloyl-ACP methyl ester carboxylesterase